NTFNRYYYKIDNSPLYTAVLILYLAYYIRYIKQVWKKEWRKPILNSVKEL
ncbi:uncharacterized protein K441DRAFT_714914, partial [Cenococcum geophilum 1.58]|uniref:uncharacterized protein n=1 Tax=Cenococcum geophilum 1.58 TaxID=794803 RepID=UPI00358E8CA1